MFQQDYLMRMFRQIMEVAMRAMGMRVQSPGEALQLIEQAKAQLPLVPGMLDAMSAASVLKLLDNPGAALALAQLYRAEALARCEQGQLLAAERAARRAQRFFAESQRTAAASDDDVLAFCELEQQLPG
jgi:hypothetical protein